MRTWWWMVVLAACEAPAPGPEVVLAQASPASAPESAPSAPSAPSDAAALHHVLSFEDRAQHYLSVETRVPVAEAGPVELWMATWTPGSYLIREYARHVEAFTAHGPDGTALSVDRVDKNRWQVEAEAPGTVTVRYRVYGNEATVRTNLIDADMAVLNGAPTFLSLAEQGGRAHRVDVVLPEGWADVSTGLDPAPSGGPHSYLAVDLDELIDSPIVAGNLRIAEFEASERPHALVLVGESGPWDLERSADDVARLVEVQQAFWGEVPYHRYLFLNVLSETRGGLEHLDSTLMMSSRWATSSRDDYLSWLGLVSHEFFHTWNVKRLRPRPLGPFDYVEEVYTPSLWIAEGFTSYYDDLLLVRAGLMTTDEYLEVLSKAIGNLQGTPGRQVQTLQEASSMAWIKHYRKDENTPNTAISYYNKGAVVGLLLDARIRTATDGARSLDDVMRLAASRYSGDAGYTPDEFEAVISEVAGTDQGPWLDVALRSTDELDYTEFLAWNGLSFEDPDAPPDESEEAQDEAAPEDPPAGWLGAELAGADGRVTVGVVKRDTPAHAAGLNHGDELIAIDGWRVSGDASQGLARLRPGAEVPLTISRRGALRTLSVTLGEEPAERWTLVEDEEAAEAVVARRDAWLRGR